MAAQGSRQGHPIKPAAVEKGIATVPVEATCTLFRVGRSWYRWGVANAADHGSVLCRSSR